MRGDAARSGFSLRRDPLDALRDATRALHDDIEAGSGMLASTAGIADYAAHLAALRGWLGEIAARCGSASDAFRRRILMRCALLDADFAELANLAALAHDPALAHRQELASALHAARAPGVASTYTTPTYCEASLLGTAYVVEGAQLGRAAVRKRISAWPLGAATRYLDHRALDYSWPHFLAELRAGLADDTAVECACAAAVAAFRRYADWAGQRPRI